jgi:hypothetical protein
VEYAGVENKRRVCGHTGGRQFNPAFPLEFTGMKHLLPGFVFLALNQWPLNTPLTENYKKLYAG